jgi:hypothetical protein
VRVLNVEDVPEWPSFNFNFPVQNSQYKIYGGAQYQRLLNEFEYVIHSREFPPTSVNELASAIGVNASHNVPLFETAVTHAQRNATQRNAHSH